MGLTGFTETSVTRPNYIPEERRPHLSHGRSLESPSFDTHGKFLSRWPVGQKSVPDEACHVIDCSSTASKSCVPSVCLSVYLSNRKSRRHVSGRTATGNQGGTAPAHETVQPHTSSKKPVRNYSHICRQV